MIIRPNGDLIERHPSLVHNSQAIARNYVNNRLVTENALQQMGQQLWQVLEQNSGLALSTAFDKAREAGGPSHPLHHHRERRAQDPTTAVGRRSIILNWAFWASKMALP